MMSSFSQHNPATALGDQAASPLCVLSLPDAVRKVFIQLAQCSFAGLPNLIKIAKVSHSFVMGSVSYPVISPCLFAFWNTALENAVFGGVN